MLSPENVRCALVLIATRIPEVGICYVQMDDLLLSVEDALKLGQELTAAAKRAQVLNSIKIALADDGAHELKAVNELLKSVLSKLGNLK